MKRLKTLCDPVSSRHRSTTGDVERTRRQKGTDLFPHLLLIRTRTLVGSEINVRIYNGQPSREKFVERWMTTFTHSPSLGPLDKRTQTKQIDSRDTRTILSFISGGETAPRVLGISQSHRDVQAQQSHLRSPGSPPIGCAKSRIWFLTIKSSKVLRYLTSLTRDPSLCKVYRHPKPMRCGAECSNNLGERNKDMYLSFQLLSLMARAKVSGRCRMRERASDSLGIQQSYNSIACQTYIYSQISSNKHLTSPSSFSSSLYAPRRPSSPAPTPSSSPETPPSSADTPPTPLPVPSTA